MAAISGVQGWLRRAHQRPGRFTVRACAPFFLISLLLLAGIASVLTLQRYADERRQTEGLVQRLQAQTNALSQVEARSLAQGRLSKKLTGQADAARAELDALVPMLPQRAGGDETTRAVVGATTAYLGAIDEEFGLLSQGRPGDARRVQDTRVDPGFDRLQVAISASVARQREAAARAEWLAAMGSVAVLLLAAGAVGLLTWRTEGARLATERAALGRSEARFRALVQNGVELVAILAPDGSFCYASPASAALLGVAPEPLVGTSLYTYVHPEDAPAAQAQLAQAAGQGADENLWVEFRLRHADGGWRYVQGVYRNLMGMPDVAGIVLNARDISERKALEGELAHRAFHDTLTELPNRALLVERLEHALARAARSGHGTALLFMDLDDFKVVNDSLGHGAGDQLLVGVAQRLRASLRTGDTAARLGGDEFVVLLEDLAEPGDATAVAGRVLDHLRAPFWLEGRQVFVQASLGIAIAATEDGLPEDLLRRADVAMYAAKTHGKGQCVMYEPSMDAQPLARLDLEGDLRQALEREEFRLHYQPIIELATGRISGVEALLRWEHPERGLVPPGEFIPFAEQMGLIVPIGRWVLREACRQAEMWRHPHAPGLVMSVNLSGRQFQHPRLVEDVAAALRETGLPAELLKLEITESVAMEAGIGTIQTLQALKGLGVQLAIDDFGTGYSSLAYLKRFPVDTLKIDRAFVDGLGQDEQDSAIVRSVIALARTLSLSVTAEGIETLEQLEELSTASCDEGQGYYFAPPQPRERVDPLIADGRLGLPVPRAA